MVKLLSVVEILLFSQLKQNLHFAGVLGKAQGILERHTLSGRKQEDIVHHLFRQNCGNLEGHTAELLLKDTLK